MSGKIPSTNPEKGEETEIPSCPEMELAKISKTKSSEGDPSVQVNNESISPTRRDSREFSKSSSPQREKDDQQPLTTLKSEVTLRHVLPFSCILFLSFATRFYKLWEPDHVW